MGLVWLGFLAGSGFLLAAAWQFADVASRRAEVTKRLETISARAVTPGVLDEVQERVGRAAPVRKVGNKLLAAGVTTNPVRFLVWCVVGGMAGFLLLLRVTSSPTLAVAVVAMAGLGVRLWLERRVEQRREQFVSQLPELARLLSNAANAGLAMRTAVEMAAREIGEPARAELRQVTELLAVGYPLDEALTAVSRRLPSREVSVLVATLVVQQRSGGRVITALRNVASTLETRKEVRREIRTQMAGAVAGTYAVAGLGIGSILLLNLMTPGVLDDMVASPVGRIVVVFSVGLYVLGFLIIRRMTRIEP